MYLAGYALKEGESLGELQGGFPDSGLADALVYTPFPVAGSTETGTDVSVAVDRFPELFAADVEPRLAAVLAVSQRPLAARAFAEKVDSSHLVMLSQPKAVAELILDAARSTGS